MAIELCQEFRDLERSSSHLVYYGSESGQFRIGDQTFAIGRTAYGGEAEITGVIAIGKLGLIINPNPIAIVGIEIIGNESFQIVDKILKHTWLKVRNEPRTARIKGAAFRGVFKECYLDPNRGGPWNLRSNNADCGEREYGLLCKEAGTEIELPSARMRRLKIERIKGINVSRAEKQRERMEKTERLKEAETKVLQELEVEEANAQAQRLANPNWGMF